MARRESGWASRPSSAESRDRSRAARKARNAFLQLHPNCRACAEASRGLVAADEVDHIKPLFKGGADTDDNRQSLCKPCHVRKSITERGWAPKRNVRIGEDGWPVE